MPPADRIRRQKPLPRRSRRPGSGCARTRAVTSLAEALSYGLKSSGITVAALCPGSVYTEFAAVAGALEAEKRTPGALMTGPEECARAGLDALERGRRTAMPRVAVRGLAWFGAHAPRAVWPAAVLSPADGLRQAIRRRVPFSHSFTPLRPRIGAFDQLRSRCAGDGAQRRLRLIRSGVDLSRQLSPGLGTRRPASRSTPTRNAGHAEARRRACTCPGRGEARRAPPSRRGPGRCGSADKRHLPSGDDRVCPVPER